MSNDYGTRLEGPNELEEREISKVYIYIYK